MRSGMKNESISQMCPDCGSPFRPCKCERGDKRVSRFGSTLKANPAKKLKARTLEERFKDNPLRYGVVFNRVRTWPCFGIEWLPGHKCRLGYAPATAHHLGKDDLDGMVPVCSWLHDQLEEFPTEVERELRLSGKPSLAGLGRMDVVNALVELYDSDELPAEILTAAQKRGLI